MKYLIKLVLMSKVWQKKPKKQKFIYDHFGYLEKYKIINFIKHPKFSLKTLSPCTANKRLPISFRNVLFE